MSSNIDQLPVLEQSTINQLITGLQEASSAGATKLPSRDIPQLTNMNDPNAKPDYIPPPPPPSQQIQHEEEMERNERDEMIRRYEASKRHSEDVEKIYNDLQMPLLIGVLYFVFQLPVYRKYQRILFPVMFFADGNVNAYGHFFSSLLFSIIYFLMHKLLCA